MRTITLQSTVNGEVKKEGPSKPLFDVEFIVKREKGLCFKCDEKYHFGHKCKDMELRELRILVVHDDNVEEEIIEEDCYDPKELNVFEMEGGVNVVELSINSLVGLTNPGTMKVRGKLQGEEVVILIDCGATHNFILDKLVNEMKLHTKETSHYGVIQGSGAAIKGKGCMQWLYSLGVTETDWRNLTMTFVHEGKKIIIKGDPSITKTRVGLKTLMKAWTDSDQGYLVECRALQGGVILSEEVMEEEVNMVPADVQTMLDKFNDVFEWPETLPPRRAIEHQIHMKLGTVPVNVRPYRYAFHQKAEMERLVDEMLSSGIIQPSNSPYSSPVLLVKKKDGSCADYRAFNNETIQYKFPILVIEELFDELNGANLFSKIDLKVGYHQIRRHKEDTEKTAFRTHEGHYEFLMMPFGLRNAPATFQSLMNSIFRSYIRKFVLVFFDDILIYSRGMEEHIYHLELVLEVLREHKLYANKKKCSFAFQKVEYLGHIVSGQGVEVDPEKTRSIKQWSVPTNVRELWGFLGLIGYYRRFVQNYGSIVAPLTQLLKLEAFKWNEEAQLAFDR
ncbi:peroxidase 64 [Cucumis melo var. makuwa]|uniref:Peroxidase 64 n=1 Tax=Cucumis melo var. makuwa TaxID=1194695 RepID=A0A5D3CU29_CUCMM|nr:peroxidase 64 [Cucumis melo var. makuwa]TYK14718.1 peroxidase 64 [Cucumis melo var. makuwa]